MIQIKAVYEFFLKKHGKFTDIQENAIPHIEKGENCIIIAPTGAGKTEAAVIPVLQRLVDDSSSTTGIRFIYITPLRALNRDMIGRIESLCKEFGITAAVRHGDTTQSERGKQARKAPQVLVTTPETMQSILPTNSIGPALRNVKALVVDEIHELYHNKRGAQLSLALERLEELAPGYQRIGISATVGDPELVKKFLCNERPCKIAQADTKKKIEVTIDLPRTYEKGVEKIRSKFALDDEALARISAITKNIKQSQSTLIFANTRQVVEALGSRLIYLNREDPFGGIGVHHGSLDKSDRIEIENSFKTGKIKSILSTSSLELGIDIGSIDLVMQYGSPRQALRLVQRVGRSGHTEKGISKGIIITANMIDTIESLAIARNVSHHRIENFSPQFGAQDVLANQICGIALDKVICKTDELLKIIRRSFVYKDITKERLVKLLLFMGLQRMVGFDGEKITAGPRTRMYYYHHLSVIPDTKRYLVKSVSDNRVISSLGEGFVMASVDESTIFITKGLPWKVISIDDNIITVEPSTDMEAAIPDWTGEDIPVSVEVTDEFLKIINHKSHLEGAHISESLSDEISKFITEQQKHGIPSRENVVVERTDAFSVIHTGLGTLANEGLSRAIAHRLSAKLGHSINMKASPYLIFLEVPGNINVETAMKEIARTDIEKLLESAVQETELFRYKFINIAKLFGLIDREAPISRSIAKRLLRVMHESPIYEEALRELMQNYFDIPTLSTFLAGVKSGQIKIEVSEGRAISPIAKVVLASAYYTRELVMPVLPKDEVVDSFVKFMLQKEVKMLCTYCGFVFQKKLEDIKDIKSIKCQSCKSTMIVQYRDEYKKVVDKVKDGKALTIPELALSDHMAKQASLFDSYGGRAAVALSTYGVGAATASRVLMMHQRQEKKFFIDLLEAQKKFIRTRKYWSI